MKFFLNALLFLLVIFSFENSAYPLSDYQIKEICKKKSRKAACTENLRLKKINLLKGNKIEIPVIPLNK